MNQTHRDNLKILQDFLMNNNVPFNMKQWRTGIDEVIRDGITKDQIDAGVEGCGTAGCAVGWAPFIIPALESELDRDSNEGSNRTIIETGTYCRRVFGCYFNDDFDFMFGPVWSNFDNTREGAAFRIHSLLEGKVDYQKFSSTVYGFNKERNVQYRKNRNRWVAAFKKASS